MATLMGCQGHLLPSRLDPRPSRSARPLRETSDADADNDSVEGIKYTGIAVL